MNSKFYVSLEAAKLLKEKGYDEEYINHYDENGGIIIPYYEHEYDKLYPAPTKAEAIDWLESKGITIEVHRNSWKGDTEWKYYILERGHREFLFSTRLEAEDAAIIKALELL